MTLFAIGAKVWPGISKLVEEAGEVLQVCGKLMGSYGGVEHWDGSDLSKRLEDELGDLMAAIDFVLASNVSMLSSENVLERRMRKLAQFHEWHTKEKEHESQD